MTAQFLSTELTAIFHESKRKNPDLKNAAEKSLSELKALPQTSETQISADLKNRPSLIRPLLIACGTRNAKLAGSGVSCLQRLIITNALSKDSLKDVLEGFRESSFLTLDVQLKVLQALPSLLQNYGSYLSGNLLRATFEICFLLYSSRIAALSNTAAAVLQQLVTATFEKAASRENVVSNDYSYEISLNGSTVTVRGAAADAYQLLNDVCLMTEGQRPNFLNTGSLAQNFGFELIESILANHSETITARPEQIEVLRLRLMPLVLKVLSEKLSFTVTVRVIRLIQLIVTRMLTAFVAECEDAIGLLNALLDPATNTWKRAIALECFRNIHASPSLVRQIYELFDEAPEKKNIIRDHFGILVRLAAEKPAIIGLGLQSSSAFQSSDDTSEQIAQVADGVSGNIAAAGGMANGEGTGLSARWSMIRVPCIDLVDKAEPPDIPATYIYALALTCINSFPDGLARFLLSLTAPSEAKSRRKQRTTEKDGESTTENREDNVQRTQPGDDENSSGKIRLMRSRKESINPLSLQDHVLYRQIRTSAHMVEHCWPALLATYSTFLSAALDTDYFHALIRSFQKFTQVAGLLDYSIPRDAFLTTLGKYSVPTSRAINNKVRRSIDYGPRRDTFDKSGGESILATSMGSPKPKNSAEFDSPTISSRNLLALRALLNLGIALGPTLQESWSIILETFQQAELLLSYSNVAGARPQTSRELSQVRLEQNGSDKITGGEDLGIEIAAAQTAATRMLESTNEYPDDAFLNFTQCLCNLFHFITLDSDHSMIESANSLLLPQTPSRKHQRFPSVVDKTPDSQRQRENHFTLDKLHELIKCNISRLSLAQGTNRGWVVISERLRTILSQQAENFSVRVSATKTFNDLMISNATFKAHGTENLELAQARALGSIEYAIAATYKEDRANLRESQACNEEIHTLLLEAIRSILDHCGESMSVGWETVFRSLMTIFDTSTAPGSIQINAPFSMRSNSGKLVRSSFGSLQLICSDYLQSIPLPCFPVLIDTLYLYCSQDIDFNISLTASTFFANVSNFLQAQEDQFGFDGSLTACRSDTDLTRLIQSNSSNPSSSMLWLWLVSRMKTIVTDHRSQVRHSVLHTLFRIFEDIDNEELSASAWRTCFGLVLSPMMRANQEQFVLITNPVSNLESKGSPEEWNKTAAALTNGVARVFVQIFESIRLDPGFSMLWNDFLDCLRLFLGRRTFSLSKSVFTALAEVLEEVDNVEIIEEPAVDEAWKLWKEFNPLSSKAKLPTESGSQEATIAYLRCIPHIYRLTSTDNRSKHASSVIHELHSCVINAEIPVYSSDIDRVTPIQKGVLENLKIIPIDTEPVLSDIIAFLADLVMLPYKQGKSNPGENATFVALSKAAIASLQGYVIHQNSDSGVPSCQLFTKALKPLAVSIQQKYIWHTQGKEPSMWRVATTAAVQILESCLSLLTRVSEPAENVLDLWNQVVKVFDGIAVADCELCEDWPTISKDQEFDIDATSRIMPLIIPALGSSHIPDSIRHNFVSTIFSISQIHEPHPDDLARPGQDLLEGLNYHHIGRTNDLPPTLRSKMSYVLLDELFRLISIHDGSAERIRLAQAAAPYLILRCGLTLKAYVYDQPLRGWMPQPLSQKREMHYILRRMSELETEPKALPEVSDERSKHKKHLLKLYPLLTRALKAAFRDQEMVKALSDVLEVLGTDLGG